MPAEIQQGLSLAAGFLITLAQVILLIDVIRKKVKPGILSWLGWAFLMGISLIAQIVEVGWQWSLTGLLLSTAGCFVIFFSALFLKNFFIKKTDWYFLLLGGICCLIYLASKNAWATTGFAILADLVVGIPTIIQAYKNPLTQKTVAWIYGLISWGLTLIACIGGSWLLAAFPIYLFLFNVLLYYLTFRRRETRQDKF